VTPSKPAWLLVALLAPALACADPATDLRQFREYFKAKFPSLRFDDYADGVVALPGAGRAPGVKPAPPAAFEQALAQGRKEWRTPFKNGNHYADCFRNGGENVAQHYPYWHDGRHEVRTAEMDLVDCLKQNGETRAFSIADTGSDAARTQLANLTAAFYELSRAQPIEVDLSSAEAMAAYDEGKNYFWAKRGRLNLACADCHMQRAGKSGSGHPPASAALGHPAAWPAYRTTVGHIDTVHQRYAACNLRVGAKPEKQGSRIYNQLQLYETYLSSGIGLSAPAIRE
jgi:L-cysteine S-thiosulfotransferase